MNANDLEGLKHILKKEEKKKKFDGGNETTCFPDFIQILDRGAIVVLLNLNPYQFH